jgi:hypothetical protein
MLALYDLLLPFAARNIMNIALLVSYGPVAHALGMLAAALGDQEKAAAHFSDAVALSERMGAVLFAARSRRMLETLGRPVASPAPAEPLPLLRQDGETRTLSHDGHHARLRDSKGIHYVAALLSEPGRELHVSDLIGQDGSGDAGALLDARAKAAYRERLERLADALEDAEELGDREAMARIRQEREALGDELSRAVGLGGRDRKAGSAAERARINVQRRIRDVLARVAEIDEALGRHLERHLKTGVFCSWRP